MYFIITLNQWIFFTCLVLAVFANTLLIQSLFWQRPWSLHTSKSEAAVHLGKRTGLVWNGEDCAKYTFLLIQGENELISGSEICITGLFWLAICKVYTSRVEFSFQICTSVLGTCKPQPHVQVCTALFSGVICCVFSLYMMVGGIKWFFLCWAGFILWLLMVSFWAGCPGDLLSLGSLHEICMIRDGEHVSFQPQGSCLQPSVMVW